MMKSVHQFLINQGADRVYCHAQMQAKPFYDYLGYGTEGDIFDEGGVKHVMMYYKLKK